jgi:hypothetical protein
VKTSRLFHFLGIGREAWLTSHVRCSFDARSWRRILAAEVNFE